LLFAEQAIIRTGGPGPIAPNRLGVDAPPSTTPALAAVPAPTVRRTVAYICLTCEVGVGDLTDEEAAATRAEGHDLEPLTPPPDDFVDDPTSGWHIGPSAAFFREIEPKAHRVVCNWCVPPTVMSEGIEPVSHGICSKCLEAMRADLAAKKAARQ
jgi:hypothetical protein